eukprot:5037078-Prymnesium_polylepis.1
MAPVDRREEMGRQKLWRWRLRLESWRCNGGRGRVREGRIYLRQRVSNDGAERGRTLNAWADTAHTVHTLITVHALFAHCLVSWLLRFGVRGRTEKRAPSLRRLWRSPSQLGGSCYPMEIPVR